MIYDDARFYVEIDGIKSNEYTQQTGIRQGCPLSPYLFLIVMTAMFHDIHNKMDKHMKQHRVTNTNFDEVLFADDTICISESAQALSKFLQTIQKEGKKYGLTLNM
eukprot:759451-Karenia_brevis.AAC.1